MIRESDPGFQVHIDLLFRSYSHYDRRNVLPVDGAWLDQSRSFLAGVDLIDAERAFWERQLHDHQQREIERSRRQTQAQQRRRR